MHADAYARPETEVDGQLRLFSLYVDFAASAYARWAAGAIARLAGPRWQCSTEMWKLDSLNASESVRKMVAGDAAIADVLIVAASSLDQREPKLIEWLDSLATWKPNGRVPGLLVGLFGDEENRSRELEWTAQQFIYCARQMDRRLLLQWMETGSTNDYGWLAEGVQTLLACKQSAPGAAFQQEAAAGVA